MNSSDGSGQPSLFFKPLLFPGNLHKKHLKGRTQYNKIYMFSSNQKKEKILFLIFKDRLDFHQKEVRKKKIIISIDNIYHEEVE